MDDAAILPAWRAGDRAAGEALLAHHFDALYEYFRAGTDAPIAELIHRSVRTATDRFDPGTPFASQLLSAARSLAAPVPPATAAPALDPLHRAWTLAAVRRSLLGADDAVRVGRFEVRDGNGATWAVYDPEHARELALVPLGATADAAALTRLRDPHVLTVHDVVTWHDARFAVVDRVDGVTLRGWLAERRRAVDAVFFIFHGAGSGLAAAHAAGLVHPGFTPDSIVVDTYGHPRVTGLTAATAPSPAPDAPASPYRAPELARGEPATARSDQYAFCAALYEAIYGEPPFARGTTGRKLRHVRQPSGATGLMPHNVRRALDRGLSASPTARFPSMTALLATLRPRKGKPIERKLAWAGGVLVVLGAIGVAGNRARTRESVESADSGEVCDADKRIAVLEARLPGMSAAIGSANRPTAPDAARETAEIVHQYLMRWHKMDRASCIATKIDHTQADAIYALRNICLQDRRRAAAMLVSQLEASGSMLADVAVQAASELPPIERCADVAMLAARTPPPPTDPDTAAKLTALSEGLDRARGDYLLGRYDTATAAATRIVEQATAIGYTAFTAEAELIAGKSGYETAERGAAAAMLEAAHRDAVAAHDDILAAEAAIAQVGGRLDGWIDPDRTDDLERLLDLASAQVARARNDPELVATLAIMRGRFLAVTGDHAGAVTAFEEARTVRAGLAGEQRFAIGVALLDAGESLRELGRDAEAKERFDAAEESWRTAFGPHHELIALAAGHQAEVAHALGDYARAIERAEASLAIERRNRSNGDPVIGEALYRTGLAYHAVGRWREARETLDEALSILDLAPAAVDDIVIALSDLALVEVEVGSYAEAEAHLDRALTLLVDEYGSDDAGVSIPLGVRGVLALRRGAPKPALAAFRRAVAVMRAGGLDDTSELAPLLLGVGRAQLALGRARDALPALDEAIALLDHADPTDRVLAAARFEHARARWMLGADRAAARADAAAAAQLLADAGAGEKYAADAAAAWLAAHP
jgi:tetratricopeptide (TPR) repeat protein